MFLQYILANITCLINNFLVSFKITFAFFNNTLKLFQCTFCSDRQNYATIWYFLLRTTWSFSRTRTQRIPGRTENLFFVERSAKRLQLAIELLRGTWQEIQIAWLISCRLSICNRISNLAVRFVDTSRDVVSFSRSRD